jgi:hypothetical protein
LAHTTLLPKLLLPALVPSAISDCGNNAPASDDLAGALVPRVVVELADTDDESIDAAADRDGERDGVASIRGVVTTGSAGTEALRGCFNAALAGADVDNKFEPAIDAARAECYSTASGIGNEQSGARNRVLAMQCMTYRFLGSR